MTGQKGNSGSQGVKGERGRAGPSGSSAPSGVTYNRWGSTRCPSGATRLYAGRVGVSHAGQGGGGNYICMPNQPEYTLPYDPGRQDRSNVFGTEYEHTVGSSSNLQYNAPCAVCYVPTRHSVLMIPAKTTCFSGWTREYFGYLMAETDEGSRCSTYACVDVSMERIPGTQGGTSGGHFYHIEVDCSGILCPPYNDYRELNCVVCSK